MPIPRSEPEAPARSLRETAVVVLTYVAATIAVGLALPSLLGPSPLDDLAFGPGPEVARTSPGPIPAGPRP